jgi:hypothetical protein
VKGEERGQFISQTGEGIRIIGSPQQDSPSEVLR